ncbi:MAG: hypothetical protein QM438_07545 [Euryarchaeota archaeon]|nr:hypothetical protein [Euryarchaeota archaeon]
MRSVRSSWLSGASPLLFLSEREACSAERRRRAGQAGGRALAKIEQMI